METKPILIIQGSKPIHVSKARKALKKFLSLAEQGSGSAPTLSTLPDDVLNKLSVLVAEFEGGDHEFINDNSVMDVEMSASSKKRKKDDISDEVPAEKKAKKEKKDKKMKKDKHSADEVAVLNTTTNVVDANKLLKMKQAVNKLKKT